MSSSKHSSTVVLTALILIVLSASAFGVGTNVTLKNNSENAKTLHYKVSDEPTEQCEGLVESVVIQPGSSYEIDLGAGDYVSFLSNESTDGCSDKSNRVIRHIRGHDGLCWETAIR